MAKRDHIPSRRTGKTPFGAKVFSYYTQEERRLLVNRVAIMFYGWTKVDAFFEAWKAAGFLPVGHIVFRKTYSSKKPVLQLSA